MEILLIDKDGWMWVQEAPLTTGDGRWELQGRRWRVASPGAVAVLGGTGTASRRQSASDASSNNSLGPLLSSVPLDFILSPPHSLHCLWLFVLNMYTSLDHVIAAAGLFVAPATPTPVCTRPYVVRNGSSSAMVSMHTVRPQAVFRHRPTLSRGQHTSLAPPQLWSLFKFRRVAQSL